MKHKVEETAGFGADFNGTSADSDRPAASSNFVEHALATSHWITGGDSAAGDR